MTLPAVSIEPEKIEELKDVCLWLWCYAIKCCGGGRSCYMVVSGKLHELLPFNDKLQPRAI